MFQRLTSGVASRASAAGRSSTRQHLQSAAGRHLHAHSAASSFTTKATANKSLFAAAGLLTLGSALYLLPVEGKLSVLSPAVAHADQKTDSREQNMSGKAGLDPKNFKKFTLKEIRPYNHNSSIFVFALEDPNAPADLPTASFVLTKADIEGEDKPVIRPYTPIDQDDPGKLHLLVKKYETGRMSKHFHSLKPGDQLEIKGPLPKIKYEQGKFQNIGMIAGGSGITPMLQVASTILANPDDNTNVTLLFANVTKDDILLKERFDALAQSADNFKVVYVLDDDSNWGSDPAQHERGRITKELIQKYLPKPEEGNQILVCGPEPMMAAVSGGKAKDLSQGELKGLLKDMGYKQENVYKF